MDPRIEDQSTSTPLGTAHRKSVATVGHLPQAKTGPRHVTEFESSAKESSPPPGADNENAWNDEQQLSDTTMIPRSRKYLMGNKNNEGGVLKENAQHEKKNTCNKSKHMHVQSLLVKLMKHGGKRQALNSHEEKIAEQIEEQEVISKCKHKVLDSDSDEDFADFVADLNNINASTRNLSTDVDESEEEVQAQVIGKVEQHSPEQTSVIAEDSECKCQPSDVSDSPAVLERISDPAVPQLTKKYDSSSANSSDCETPSGSHATGLFPKPSSTVQSLSPVYKPCALTMVNNSAFLCTSTAFSGCMMLTPPSYVTQYSFQLTAMTRSQPIICTDRAFLFIATLASSHQLQEHAGKLLETVLEFVRRARAGVLTPTVCLPQREPVKVRLPEKSPCHTPVVPVEKVMGNLIPLSSSSLNKEHPPANPPLPLTINECGKPTKTIQRHRLPGSAKKKACTGGNTSSGQTPSTSGQKAHEQSSHDPSASNTHQPQHRKGSSGDGGGGEDPQRPRGKKPLPAHYAEPLEEDDNQLPDKQDGTNTLQRKHNESGKEATVKPKDSTHTAQSGSLEGNGGFDPKCDLRSAAYFNARHSATESEGESVTNPNHLVTDQTSDQKECTEKVGTASLAVLNEVSQDSGKEADPDMQKCSGQPRKGKKSTSQPRGKHGKSQHPGSPSLQCSKLCHKSTYSSKRGKKSLHGPKEKVTSHKQHGQPTCHSAERKGNSINYDQSITPQQLEVDTQARSGVSPASVSEQDREAFEQAHTIRGQRKVLPTGKTGREPPMYGEKHTCVYPEPSGRVVSSGTSSHTTESEGESSDHFNQTSDQKECTEEVDIASLTRRSEESQDCGEEVSSGVQVCSVQPKKRTKRSGQPRGKYAKPLYPHSPDVRHSQPHTKIANCSSKGKERVMSKTSQTRPLMPHSNTHTGVIWQDNVADNGQGVSAAQCCKSVTPEQLELCVPLTYDAPSAKSATTDHTQTGKNKALHTAKRPHINRKHSCVDPDLHADVGGEGASDGNSQPTTQGELESDMSPGHLDEILDHKECTDRVDTASLNTEPQDSGTEDDQPSQRLKQRKISHPPPRKCRLQTKQTALHVNSLSEFPRHRDDVNKPKTKPLEERQINGSVESNKLLPGQLTIRQQLEVGTQMTSGASANIPERAKEAPEHATTSHTQAEQSEKLPTTAPGRKSHLHNPQQHRHVVSDDARSPHCRQVKPEARGERYKSTDVDNATKQDVHGWDNGCRHCNSESTQQEEKKKEECEPLHAGNTPSQPLSSLEHDITHQSSGVQADVNRKRDKGSHQQLQPCVSTPENGRDFPHHPRGRHMAGTVGGHHFQQHKPSSTSAILSEQQSELQTGKSQVLLEVEQKQRLPKKEHPQKDSKIHRRVESSNGRQGIPAVEQQAREEVSKQEDLNTHHTPTQPESSPKHELIDQNTGVQANTKVGEYEGSHLELSSSAQFLGRSRQHSKKSNGLPTTTTTSDNIQPHQSRTSSDNTQEAASPHTTTAFMQAEMGLSTTELIRKPHIDQERDGKFEGNHNEQGLKSDNSIAVSQEKWEETEKESENEASGTQNASDLPTQALLPTSNCYTLGDSSHHDEPPARKDDLQHKPSTQCSTQTETRLESCVPGQGAELNNSQPVLAAKCGTRDGEMTQWEALTTREEKQRHELKCIPGKVNEGMMGSCEDRHDCRAPPSDSVHLTTSATPHLEVDWRVRRQLSPQSTCKRAKNSIPSSNPSTYSSAVSPPQSSLQGFLSVPPTPQNQHDTKYNADSPLEAMAKGDTSQVVNLPKLLETSQQNKAQHQRRMKRRDGSKRSRDRAHTRRINSEQATYRMKQHKKEQTRTRPRQQVKKWKKCRKKQRHRRQAGTRVHQDINLRVFLGSAHLHHDHFSGSKELVGSAGLLPSVELSPTGISPQPCTDNYAANSEMVTVQSLHSVEFPPQATERYVVGTYPFSHRCNGRGQAAMESGITPTQLRPRTIIAHASHPVQEQSQPCCHEGTVATEWTRRAESQHNATVRPSVPTQEVSVCQHSYREQYCRRRTCIMQCSVRRLEPSDSHRSCPTQRAGTSQCPIPSERTPTCTRTSSYHTQETTGLQENSRARFVFLSPSHGGLAPAVQQQMLGTRSSSIHSHFCIQHPPADAHILEASGEEESFRDESHSDISG